MLFHDNIKPLSYLISSLLNNKLSLTLYGVAITNTYTNITYIYIYIYSYTNTNTN